MSGRDAATPPHPGYEGAGHTRWGCTAGGCRECQIRSGTPVPNSPEEDRQNVVSRQDHGSQRGSRSLLRALFSGFVTAPCPKFPAPFVVCPDFRTEAS
ncbi:hypothetical protein CRV15_14520 [Streptomyces clavuligerus]|uniref:Uncharacterized protein n=1 Tax=Streptomyces clavuligerus TaxID=1901 RepID=B5GWM3_STRCL|nr:hypothetical protein D1794_15170 [Streptomyces clavuligerus]EDY50719.1 hypothetical protein SSCG_03729 [Streptomyces clavuligerus]EFG07870.1 Hypothetical protein SCLAV_2798 [Streptomyces clavuligerus]QCS06730.1 hypothetical protein CRV15_14520 [Streptomyces clavuligerus]QPJ93919.1 hypothetical protein GE265_13495 [Streptomyces clavuligerus]